MTRFLAGLALGLYVGHRLTVWHRRRQIIKAVRQMVQEDVDARHQPGRPYTVDQWDAADIQAHRGATLCGDYSLGFPLPTGIAIPQHVDTELPKS